MRHGRQTIEKTMRWSFWGGDGSECRQSFIVAGRVLDRSRCVFSSIRKGAIGLRASAGNRVRAVSQRSLGEPELDSCTRC